jgi:hypothetical protein
MLHDVGWTEFDADPGVDDSGRPVTFDRMQVSTHLDIWRASVHRAAAFSRYAGLLVAYHFSKLLKNKSADLLDRGDMVGGRAAETFGAEMDRLQEGWRESLRMDARYAAHLEEVPWRINTGLLDACDKLSVYLCASLGSPFTLVGLQPDGEGEEIHVSRVSGNRWKVRPWPLEGDRLKLQVEGRRLGTSRFATADELKQAIARAPVERLTFTLARPSAC